MASEPAAKIGLLVDYGGVLTTDLFASFGAFCTAEGLDPDELMRRFRTDPQAREALIGLEEGRLPEAEFEAQLGAMLNVEPSHLIERLMAGSSPEPAMLTAVLKARHSGVRTGLISNSWGTSRYDRERLAELFDGVVISGEVGMRKPAPDMYRMGAESIGVDPAACVFVDDLPFNLTPAAELGMATVHHTDPERTVDELERILGLPLR
jgi:epoxide hydrolase-like predicted phosphatase